MEQITISKNDIYPVFYERPGKPKWELAHTIEEIAEYIGISIPSNKAERNYILLRLRTALYQFRDEISEDSNHYLIGLKLIEGDHKVYLITRDCDKIETATRPMLERKRNLESRIKGLKNFGQGLLFSNTRKAVGR